jgi:hypothetical protein
MWHVLGFYGSAFFTGGSTACPTVPVTTITYQIVMSKRDRFLKESGEAVFALLKLTSASADAFPPLKSAAGGALHIVEIVLVCRYRMRPFRVSAHHCMHRNSSRTRENGPTLPYTSRIPSRASFNSFPISTSPEAILCRIWRS